jgi:glycosyltransferase involved in cell wall biosynthesis
MSTKKHKKFVKITNKIELVKHPTENKFILDVPVLNEDELPTISVITITRNRKHLFDMPIYNWSNFLYPRQKLEWVIVDDSDNDDQDNDDQDLSDKLILLKNHSIKYLKVHKDQFLNKNNKLEFMDIAAKRNYAVENSSGEYIAIMDDDDYYFPDNLMAKVRILKHTKFKCCFSIPYGVYNVSRKTSHIVGETNKISDGQVPEASLFFKKEFWEKENFKHKFKTIKGKETKLGEAYGLINGREKHCINIPFWINLITITHIKNITGNLRQYHVEENTTESRASFFDFWDKEVQEIIIKNY